MDEERRIQSWAQDPRFVPSIGRTIKVLRTDRGLDRKDLAEEVGISYSYLTEIENGNKPPSSTVLAAIATALDVQLHELIAGAEERVQREALREEELMPSSDARRVNQLRTYAGTWAEPLQDPSAPGLSSLAYGKGRRPRPRTPEPTSLWELRDLLERLSPEDVQRVLDLARRLAR